MTNLEYKNNLAHLTKTPAWAPQLNADGTVKRTFCNYFVSACAALFGYHFPTVADGNGKNVRPLMANEMIRHLTEQSAGPRVKPEWSLISIADYGRAIDFAGETPRLVIAGQTEKLHGHVNILFSNGPWEFSGTYGIAVPWCANIGKTNGIFRLSKAFKTMPELFLYTSQA